MPIVFACVCGKQLRAKDGSAGRAFRCPACQADVVVPLPEAVDLGIELASAPATRGVASVGMADDRIDRLAGQVEQLRRSVWRWRLAGVALLSLSLATSAFAILAEIGDRSRTSIDRPLVRARAILAEVVTADSFVIRDENGKPRGGIGCGPGQVPSMTLMDEAGAKRVSIFLQADGSPYIALSAPNGKARVMLAANEGGESGLVLNDEPGQNRASLSYGGKAVGLKLFEGGQLRSEHRVWDNGVPSTIFYYPNGREAASIGGGGVATPSINMYDANGDERIDLEVFDDGRPILTMSDRAVATRFQLGVHKDGVPYFDFFDLKDEILPVLGKDGRPLFYK